MDGFEGVTGGLRLEDFRSCALNGIERRKNEALSL